MDFKNCSFSSRKFLWRILHRKCSKKCYPIQTRKLLHQILERKIDLDKLCNFSTQKSQFQQILL